MHCLEIQMKHYSLSHEFLKKKYYYYFQLQYFQIVDFQDHKLI